MDPLRADLGHSRFERRGFRGYDASVMRVRRIAFALTACAMIVTGSAGAFGSRPGQMPGTLHVHFVVVDGVVDTNGPYTVMTRPRGARIVVDETSGRRTRVNELLKAELAMLVLPGQWSRYLRAWYRK